MRCLSKLKINCIFVNSFIFNWSGVWRAHPRRAEQEPQDGCQTAVKTQPGEVPHEDSLLRSSLSFPGSHWRSVLLQSALQGHVEEKRAPIGGRYGAFNMEDIWLNLPCGMTNTYTNINMTWNVVGTLKKPIFICIYLSSWVGTTLQRIYQNYRSCKM